MKKHVSFLIKPASSLCNMRCRYCFYYDVADHRNVRSFGIMKEETMKVLVDKALELGDDSDISFHFQGGEPTVAGLVFFEKFVSYVRQKKTNQTVHYALQTNATLLDEKWIDFFYKNRFLIGVSLDGYQEMHNYFRKDCQNKDTYKTVKVYIREEEYPEVIEHMKTRGYTKLSGYIKDLIAQDMERTGEKSNKTVNIGRDNIGTINM